MASSLQLSLHRSSRSFDRVQQSCDQEVVCLRPVGAPIGVRWERVRRVRSAGACRRADRVAAAWKRRSVDWCERSIGECWVWRASAFVVVGVDGGLSGGEELVVASCALWRLRRLVVVT